MSPRSLLALFLAGVSALAVVVAVALSGGERSAAPAAAEPAGALLPDGVRAPSFSLTDESGESVAMRELRGSPVIVTFLYTHCEETCPPTATA